jgi:DHA1 family bicyclomycin/chloramphenicol resistance-like MFS transporter
MDKPRPRSKPKGDVHSPRMRFLDRATPPHIFTLIVLTGLGALSMNIFLPSLPAMTEHFDTDYRLMQLSVALYLAVNAVLQIVVGPISDRYGRRPSCSGASPSSFWPRWAASSRPRSRSSSPSACCRRSSWWASCWAARWCATCTPGSGRQPDRLCHDGHGRGADDRPGHRRRAGRNLGWQANFWMLAIIGACPRPVWRDLGETAARGLPASPSSSRIPRAFRLPPLLGLLPRRRLRLGRLLRLSRRRALCGLRGLRPLRGRGRPYFGAPALGYFFGNWLSGRYSVRVGINGMILWGTILSTAGPDRVAPAVPRRASRLRCLLRLHDLRGAWATAW